MRSHRCNFNTNICNLCQLLSSCLLTPKLPWCVLLLLCRGWDAAGPCQCRFWRQLAGLRQQDVAPSCLPVCERHAATSSGSSSSCSGFGCSFPNTWFTIEPPQTQATASAPHRSELQLQKGPLSVNNSTLSLGPPSPRVVDAPTRCCLRYLSSVSQIRFLSHLEGLIRHRALGRQGFLLP